VAIQRNYQLGKSKLNIELGKRLKQLGKSNLDIDREKRLRAANSLSLNNILIAGGAANRDAPVIDSTPSPTLPTPTPTPTSSYDNEFIYTESPEYDQVVSIINNSNSEVIS
jgi:hypothetical protein